MLHSKLKTSFKSSNSCIIFWDKKRKTWQTPLGLCQHGHVGQALWGVDKGQVRIYWYQQIQGLTQANSFKVLWNGSQISQYFSLTSLPASHGELWQAWLPQGIVLQKPWRSCVGSPASSWHGYLNKLWAKFNRLKNCPPSLVLLCPFTMVLYPLCLAIHGPRLNPFWSIFWKKQVKA